MTNDGYIKATIENLKEQVKTFVTKDEFFPVKMIAYGIASSVLLGVLGAILSFVLYRKQ